MQDWTNVLTMLRVGGWVIYPLAILAILAILAVTIFFDRAYTLLRFGVMPAAAREPS